MPPGHVSGAEAAAMAQQHPAVGTVVVQPQAQVVQPTVVQPQQPAPDSGGRPRCPRRGPGGFAARLACRKLAFFDG